MSKVKRLPTAMNSLLPALVTAMNTMMSIRATPPFPSTYCSHQRMQESGLSGQRVADLCCCVIPQTC